jgi:hypothetical protein
METTKQATEAAPTKPKKARKPRSKVSKKTVTAAVRADALLGKRFTHRTRSEWGIGTVVDGADNALVLAWSDGMERRTARSYMDHLIEVP